jgi:hypothetical protein
MRSWGSTAVAATRPFVVRAVPDEMWHQVLTDWGNPSPAVLTANLLDHWNRARSRPGAQEPPFSGERCARTARTRPLKDAPISNVLPATSCPVRGLVTPRTQSVLIASHPTTPRPSRLTTCGEGNDPNIARDRGPFPLEGHATSWSTAGGDSSVFYDNDGQRPSAGPHIAPRVEEPPGREALLKGLPFDSASQRRTPCPYRATPCSVPWSPPRPRPGRCSGGPGFGAPRVKPSR